MNAVARLIPQKNRAGSVLVFDCPGCKEAHGVWVDGAVNDLTGAQWDWNHDLAAPTISPSILVIADRSRPDAHRCHSFVREGRIEFLSDCTHELAGKTVPLSQAD